MTKPTTFTDEAVIAAGNLADYASDLITPTVRLGVTGLSRSGKTIFITALIHNLLNGGRLPLFGPYADGRLVAAALVPLTSGTVPEFDYHAHIRDLSEQRIWPESTKSISEIRIALKYQSRSFFARRFGTSRLNIDIVDYPGEWLLDLPLLSKSYAQWSAEAVTLSREDDRVELAAQWHQHLQQADPASEQGDGQFVQALSAAFTEYLRRARGDRHALSLLPPGRFLMPGDMAGSPALTFSPLPLGEQTTWPRQSLAGLMEARFEAYKSDVVRPFFRNHFARLDRQIVLVDALNAANAGAAALHDLELALKEILMCFRPGANNWLSSLLTKRIDRIAFAATKADHVHQADHPKLEAILTRLVGGAMRRAKFTGAEIRPLALAAVRATREGSASVDGHNLPTLVGTPISGQQIDGQRCDGETEFAIFPGDLPDDIDRLFPAAVAAGSDAPPLNFVRFRPPALNLSAGQTLPHIRLDRAMDFLLGDRLA